MLNKIRREHPEYDDMPDNDLMAAIHQKHYSDMPIEEFMMRTQRPSYDDLEKSAITGADSLDLQEMEASIKPVVKMAFKQFSSEFAKRDMTHRISVILPDGTAYVIDTRVVSPEDAFESIMSGQDSEILGYPEPGDCDCGVTKQGEVVKGPLAIKMHVPHNNLIWAASGNEPELSDKAQRVSEVVRGALQRKLTGGKDAES